MGRAREASTRSPPRVLAALRPVAWAPLQCSPSQGATSLSSPAWRALRAPCVGSGDRNTHGPAAPALSPPVPRQPGWCLAYSQHSGSACCCVAMTRSLPVPLPRSPTRSRPYSWCCGLRPTWESTRPAAPSLRGPGLCQLSRELSPCAASLSTCCLPGSSRMLQVSRRV